MFEGCSGLRTAAELPATAVSTWSYAYMFAGCSNLTSAPSALPALSLDDCSYYYMFEDCASLSTAPAISATNVKHRSCDSMFLKCSKLTTPPPVLPAVDLSTYSYYRMFKSCYKLSSAPVVSATSLTTHSCSEMFYACSSLADAPHLPAVSGATNSYNSMFRSCSNLSSASIALTSWGGTSDWFNSVASAGVLSCPAVLGDNASIKRGVTYCPTNWNVVNPDAKLARYLKWEIQDVADSQDVNGHKYMQVSELRFVDLSGKSFQYDVSAECLKYTTGLDVGGVWRTEWPENLLDGDVSTKMTIEYGYVLPFHFVFDLKTPVNLGIYSRYQWWTANDDEDFPDRSPTAWKLSYSNDLSTWKVLDEVSNFTAPISNYALAY